MIWFLWYLCSDPVEFLDAATKCGTDLGMTLAPAGDAQDIKDLNALNLDSGELNMWVQMGEGSSRGGAI